MAIFNYKKFIASGRKNSLKKYLYVFRALMSGIYVLETGKVEPNLEKLARHFHSPLIKRLIRLKRKGKEKDELPSSIDNGKLENEILKLLKRLDRDYLKSKLPDTPSKEIREEVESFLIKMRRKELE